jgi:hypothetical protein
MEHALLCSNRADRKIGHYKRHKKHEQSELQEEAPKSGDLVELDRKSPPWIR